MKQLKLILVLTLMQFSVFAKNKLLILLNPGDCGNVKIQLQFILKDMNHPYRFLLPDKGNDAYRFYHSKLPLLVDSTHIIMDSNLFEQLRGNLSSFYILNEKNAVLFQTKIYGISTTTLGFLEHLLKGSVNVTKENEFTMPFDMYENETQFKKIHNRIYAFNAEREIFSITDSSVLQIQSDHYKGTIDSIANSIKNENRKTLDLFKIDYDQFFKENLGGDAYELINYSIQKKSIILLLKFQYLNARKRDHDTVVSVLSRYFLVEFSTSNFLVIHASELTLNGLNMNYYSEFDMDGSQMLATLNCSNYSGEPPYVLISLPWKSPSPIDSVKNLSKMPDLLFHYYNCQFSDMHRSENLVYFVSEATCFNLISGKTKHFSFPDSFYYQVKISEDTFQPNFMLKSFFCSDIRQVDINAYQMLFRYDKMIYLADLVNDRIIQLQELMPSRNLMFIKFTGVNKVITNEQYSRKISRYLIN